MAAFGRDKFEETCDEIVRIVNEDDTRWDLNALVDTACEKTGIKYKPNIAMAVKAMIRCGFLKGYMGTRNYESIRVNTDLGSSSDAALRKQVDDIKAELKAQTEKLTLAERAEKIAKDMAEKSQTILEVKVTMPNGKTVSHKGVFHRKFAKILQLAKKRKNIFLYGPTGLGKSHICKQVADVLGLPFGFIQCTSGMSEGQIGGRLLPVNKDGSFDYVMSEFVKAYEEGGVFLLDEIDAADPNVLLLINAALANGRMAVPNRPGKPYAVRHKDFICIAAANTVGHGADRLYSGRNKLDAATLDRFQIGKICLDYDEGVDRVLCPDDGLRTRLQRYRAAVLDNKLERAVSTRFMMEAYDMKGDGWTDADIDEALFAGWKADEISKVRNYRPVAA